MATTLKPISQKQFLVTIGDLQGYFTKATAPGVTRDETEYNDGQTGQTKVHVGFIKQEKVTLSKPYVPKDDAAVLKWVEERLKDNKVFTVTITPVEPDKAGTPVQGGKKITLVDCQLTGFKHPEVDRMGSGTAMLELMLIPDDVSFA